MAGIDVDVMSWTEDWNARGITANCADVAAASCSIGTLDMRDSFERLTRVARRRACITLPTGPSPRSDERILDELGLLDELGRDYLYAFAILVQMGLHPEVSYIESVRDDSYADAQEAYESLEGMILSTAGAAADKTRRPRPRRPALVASRQPRGKRTRGRARRGRRAAQGAQAAPTAHDQMGVHLLEHREAKLAARRGHSNPSAESTAAPPRHQARSPKAGPKRARAFSRASSTRRDLTTASA